VNVICDEVLGQLLTRLINSYYYILIFNLFNNKNVRSYIILIIFNK